MYDSADIYTSVQLPYVSTKAALANIECCPHVVLYAYYQPSTRIGRDCTRGGILDRSQSTRERTSHKYRCTPPGIYNHKTHCATIHLLIVSHMEGVSIKFLAPDDKKSIQYFLWCLPARARIRKRCQRIRTRKGRNQTRNLLTTLQRCVRKANRVPGLTQILEFASLATYQQAKLAVAWI